MNLNTGNISRYAEEGCEYLRLKGDNMQPHESQCMFRYFPIINMSVQHLSLNEIIMNMQSDQLSVLSPTVERKYLTSHY